MDRVDQRQKMRRDAKEQGQYLNDPCAPLAPLIHHIRRGVMAQGLQRHHQVPFHGKVHAQNCATPYWQIHCQNPITQNIHQPVQVPQLVIHPSAQLIEFPALAPVQPRICVS